MRDLGQFHVLHGSLQVRPRFQGDVPEFLEGRKLVGEIERPGDVESLDRRPVVQEHQELDLGRAKIHHRRFEVGFELDALQLQAIQIHLRQVAGLEALAIHVEFAVPVVQVLLRVLQHRFRLQCLVRTRFAG